jgi:hypothetical protein
LRGLSGARKYDERISVGATRQNIPHSTMKGETHG